MGRLMHLPLTMANGHVLSLRAVLQDASVCVFREAAIMPFNNSRSFGK